MKEHLKENPGFAQELFYICVKRPGSKIEPIIIVDDEPGETGTRTAIGPGAGNPRVIDDELGEKTAAYLRL